MNPSIVCSRCSEFGGLVGTEMFGGALGEGSGTTPNAGESHLNVQTRAAWRAERISR